MLQLFLQYYFQIRVSSIIFCQIKHLIISRHYHKVKASTSLDTIFYVKNPSDASNHRELSVEPN